MFQVLREGTPIDALIRKQLEGSSVTKQPNDNVQEKDGNLKATGMGFSVWDEMLFVVGHVVALLRFILLDYDRYYLEKAMDVSMRHHGLMIHARRNISMEGSSKPNFVKPNSRIVALFLTLLLVMIWQCCYWTEWVVILSLLVGFPILKYQSFLSEFSKIEKDHEAVTQYFRQLFQLMEQYEHQLRIRINDLKGIELTARGYFMYVDCCVLMLKLL